MYRYDCRASQWQGTAFGVVQAFNTWNHHERPTVKSTDRAERNMLDAVTGTTAAEDAGVLATLSKITG